MVFWTNCVFPLKFHPGVKCLSVFFSFFILRWNFIPLFLTGGNSYRDGISSRQKRENSKRHFTIHRKDFITGWNFTCKHPLIWDSVMTILCRNKINKFTIALRLRIKYSKGLGYTFLFKFTYGSFLPYSTKSLKFNPMPNKLSILWVIVKNWFAENSATLKMDWFCVITQPRFVLMKTSWRRLEDVFRLLL